MYECLSTLSVSINLKTTHQQNYVLLLTQYIVRKWHFAYSSYALHFVANFWYYHEYAAIEEQYFDFKKLNRKHTDRKQMRSFFLLN